MKPDFSKLSAEDLDALLTGLAVGELTAQEAEALRRFIQDKPELVHGFELRQKTAALVRETVLGDKGIPTNAPVRLSDDRREKLLAAFKAKASTAVPATRERRSFWYVPMSVAAVLIALLVAVVVIGEPRSLVFKKARGEHASAMTVYRMSSDKRDDAKAMADLSAIPADRRSSGKRGGAAMDFETAGKPLALNMPRGGSPADEAPPKAAKAIRDLGRVEESLSDQDFKGPVPAEPQSPSLRAKESYARTRRIFPEGKTVARKEAVAGQKTESLAANAEQPVTAGVEVRSRNFLADVRDGSGRQENFFADGANSLGDRGEMALGLKSSDNSVLAAGAFHYSVAATPPPISSVSGVSSGGAAAAAAGPQSESDRFGTTAALATPAPTTAPAPTAAGRWFEGGASTLSVPALQPAEKSRGFDVNSPAADAPAPSSPAPAAPAAQPQPSAGSDVQLYAKFADVQQATEGKLYAGAAFDSLSVAQVNPSAGAVNGAFGDSLRRNIQPAGVGGAATPNNANNEWSFGYNPAPATQGATAPGRAGGGRGRGGAEGLALITNGTYGGDRFTVLGDSAPRGFATRVPEQREALAKDVKKLAELPEVKLKEAERLGEDAQKQILELNRNSSVASDPAPAKPASVAPVPQPETLTRENAFSTFSLNVADVSFKLAAASLERGAMPDAANIRSEEFINAFDYRDSQPAPGVPVAFASERARYPFAQNREVLRFSVKTAAQGREGGKPLNIIVLLDNSGSMERADRVRITQECLRTLAAQFQPQDKLSVVTFARTARLWVDGVAGSQAAEVARQVSTLTPEGGTNLEDALDLAYRTALRHFQPQSINRVVLLTDGAANLGNIDPQSLKQKVETNRKQGIAFDCFGVGWEGYNDDLLETLSRNGDGRYGFINSPEEAATEFTGQLAGALRVAASDVKVQVEFNPKRTTAYRQVGYAKHQLTKEQFRDNAVDAAEIGAAEAGNALYVVETNPNGDGPIATVRVRYKVPGTSDYRENEWTVPYTPAAPALEQSSAAMRLAVTASAFSEWLASSPFATEVSTDRLLKIYSGVPDTFGADPRPGRLEWMIRQAKSISGR